MLPRHSMPRRNARRMPRRMPRRKSSMLYVADHGHTLYAPLPPLRKTSTKLYASSTQALRSLDAEMPRLWSNEDLYQNSLICDRLVYGPKQSMYVIAVPKCHQAPHTYLYT